MKRDFIPGSQWLYLKIYTGHKSADEVLTDCLYPATEQLQSEQLIDSYFFIRYTDPKFHIRFRFNVPDVLNYGMIFQILHNSLSLAVENGIISNILCDTYRREIARYGSSSIELSEEMFWIDSRSILALMKRLSESSEPDFDRWRLSLRLIDDTLSAFGYSTEEKKELLEAMSSDFKKEFGFIHSTFTKQLNDKYRMHRKNIDESFDLGKPFSISYSGLLDTRRVELECIAKKIEPALSESDISKEAYIRSVIHMTMNRLFRSKNRLYEMVIYDFLCRYYQSTLAKAKYSNTVK